MPRLLVTALVLLLSTPSLAAIVTFTDRTVFNTAAGSLPIEDFEESLAPNGGFTTITGPLDSTSSNAAFSPGDILPGLQLVDRPGPDGAGMNAGGTGLFAGATKTVLNNTFSDSLDLIFAGGTSAIGFDLYSAAAPGSLQNASVSIELFDLANASLGVFAASAINTGSVFFGAVSDSALIGRVNVFSQSNGAETVDNVAFRAAVVPEPSTYLLCAAGLLALFGFGWRRRQCAA
jgi:hypothetical protein